MIVFTRSAGIAPGKTTAMIGFAQEITAYVRRSYAVDLEVLMPVGGNPQRIAWTTRYNNLAEMEAANEKMVADRAYWELIAKASDCFVPGSVHDDLWRTV